MNATIELLSKQHQEVLARLQAVESGFAACGANNAVEDFVGYLESDVAHHFALEEHALFPLLARHLSLTQGPLAVMNAEHTTFRELMRSLGTGLREGNIEQQHRCTQELIELLRAHIAKEDNVLFPMADRMLSPDEHCEVDSRAAALERPGTAG